MNRLMMALALVMVVSICNSASFRELASVRYLPPGEAAQANKIPPGPPAKPVPETMMVPSSPAPTAASPVICSKALNSAATTCVQSPHVEP